MVFDNLRDVFLATILGLGLVGLHAAEAKCKEYQFECQNGKCARLSYRCNGVDGGCSDGSDEGDLCLSFQCLTGYRKCADNKQCIKESYLCDGDDDCGDKSDEGFDTCADFQCPEGYRKCADNIQCVRESKWCDGRARCNDGSDENDCESYQCLAGHRKCGDNKECLREHHWCDGTDDCNDKSDEADCEDYQCLTKYRKCGDRKTCITETWFCDDYEDCSDGSDEAKCKPKETVCISVAIDVSESLYDQIHLDQEAAILDLLWAVLTSYYYFDSFTYVINIFPFNNNVDDIGAGPILSNKFSYRSNFMLAEEQKFNDIRTKIKNTQTGEQTDMAAVVDYVIDLNCQADHHILFLISDFILTAGEAVNPQTLQVTLETIKAKGYKLVAIALDKERIEANFEKAAEVSGYGVDTTQSDYAKTLKKAVKAILHGP